MKRRSKQLVVTGILVGGLALAGTGVAMAATKDPSGSGSTSDAGEQDPSYTGSVAAPADNGAEGTDTQASEADEAKSLAGLATTTPEQAQAAALAAVPGTGGSVQLENENGFVVYGVEVTGADGTTVDVKVDAGDGTVLAQDDSEGTETGDEGAETESEDTESNDITPTK